MIDWNTITTKEVKKHGSKLIDLPTFLSIYSVYCYCDHIVMIHEKDEEIAAAWQQGFSHARLVYLHPVTCSGLEKLKKLGVM